MDIELTGEELRWMYSVFKGEFRIVPPRIVKSVISKGLGIPNLGGAFNLTRAGRDVFRRTPQGQGDEPADEEMHIIRSKARSRSNWRLG
ncbi:MULTISPECIES: hypothetical protein [unclassified Herbaspirillum]|uniref:hypothetical protein n=1 Tax=unclassified Herbaspirillum TaxID=2624150 RepID=UPI001150A96B|nr:MULTISPECIES: hypothetical protein [unclassified Herbaspirillum]MBB5392889.1 hypothetical protein [Herbaspirillum sp. SJZ102]